MADDYKLLGLGELTSLITHVKINHWGTEVSVECIYDPKGERLPYQLTFRNCQEIQWNVHDLESTSDLEADLIGLCLGKESYQQPAVIHTDIFELAISYDKYSLERVGISTLEESNDLQGVVLELK